MICKHDSLEQLSLVQTFAITNVGIVIIAFALILGLLFHRQPINPLSSITMGIVGFLVATFQYKQRLVFNKAVDAIELQSKYFIFTKYKLRGSLKQTPIKQINCTTGWVNRPSGRRRCVRVEVIGASNVSLVLSGLVSGFSGAKVEDVSCIKEVEKFMAPVPVVYKDLSK